MRNSFSDIRWLNCQNVSGQTIPPFSCVRVTDTNIQTGVLKVNQPNADGQDVMITREAAIAPNGYGLCTMDWPVMAAYNSGDGTPAVGDSWGPANGSWNLRKNKNGFGIIGGVNATAMTVVAYRNFPSSTSSSAGFIGGLYENGPAISAGQASGVNCGVTLYGTGVSGPTNGFAVITPGYYVVGAKVEFNWSGANGPGGDPDALSQWFRVILNGLNPPLAANVQSFYLAVVNSSVSQPFTLENISPPLALTSANNNINVGIDASGAGSWTATPKFFWIEKVG